MSERCIVGVDIGTSAIKVLAAKKQNDGTIEVIGSGFVPSLGIDKGRISDIQAAFVAAIELNPKGYRYLRTDSFIEKLRGFNWHFTRADANAWIERNQPGFADKTTNGSDNRYWILRNMGRVL